LWVRLLAQNGQKQRTFFWNSSVYSCSEKWKLFHARNRQETEDLLQCCAVALTRIERGVGGPGAQLSKRTSTFMKGRDLSKVLYMPDLYGKMHHAPKLCQNRTSDVWGIECD
jgi:hypothetical protein